MAYFLDDVRKYCFFNSRARRLRRGRSKRVCCVFAYATPIPFDGLVNIRVSSRTLVSTYQYHSRSLYWTQRDGRAVVRSPLGRELFVASMNSGGTADRLERRLDVLGLHFFF